MIKKTDLSVLGAASMEGPAMSQHLLELIEPLQHKIDQQGLGTLMGTYVFVVDNETVVLAKGPKGYCLTVGPAPDKVTCTITGSRSVLASILTSDKPQPLLMRLLASKKLTIQPLHAAMPLAMALSGLSP